RQYQIVTTRNRFGQPLALAGNIAEAPGNVTLDRLATILDPGGIDQILLNAARVFKDARADLEQLLSRATAHLALVDHLLELFLGPPPYHRNAAAAAQGIVYRLRVLGQDQEIAVEQNLDRGVLIEHLLLVHLLDLFAGDIKRRDRAHHAAKAQRRRGGFT